MKQKWTFILLLLAGIMIAASFSIDTSKNEVTDVKSFGAAGDGVTDDTAAIQSAINHAYSMGGGSVSIPDGTYLIDADARINMKSNITLVLSDNAVLKTKATSSPTYYVVSALNVSNIEIIGGKIVGDRKIHLGTSGEWGHGIRIANSSNVRITNVTVTDCWGDGIYIGASYTEAAGEANYCSNVTIQGCKVDNSRRDGISIISVKNLLIKDCVLSNSNGTLPECGLVFEPNNADEFVQNVVVENLKTVNNANYGIAFNLSNVETSVNNVDITVMNHTDLSSVRGALSPLNEFEQGCVVIE